MFEVKKGVPIPPRKSQFDVYPFSSMEIGDMFEVGSDLRPKAAAAASNYGKRNGRKFSTKMLDGSGERFGVWRIK